MGESRFEEGLPSVDVVLDTIGGETQDRSFAVLKPGGVLVSAVATSARGIRSLRQAAACIGAVVGTGSLRSWRFAM